MKTQKTRRSRSDAVEQEKSTGKKMVQARLPFKLVTTPTSESEKSAGTGKTESRKRKLSFKEPEETGKNSSIIEQSPKRRSVKNYDANGSKAKEKQSIVILSDDSNDRNDIGRISKENVKTIAKHKACENKEESLDVHSDDVELIGSTDEEEMQVPEMPKAFATPVTKKTEKGITKTSFSEKSTEKKTTTPKNGNNSTGKGRKKSEQSPSAGKLQIKLPVNGKKNKRRKQAAKVDATAEENELSDDVEIISKELHPEKRPKLDSPQKAKKVDGKLEKRANLKSPQINKPSDGKEGKSPSLKSTKNKKPEAKEEEMKSERKEDKISNLKSPQKDKQDDTKEDKKKAAAKKQEPTKSNPVEKEGKDDSSKEGQQVASSQSKLNKENGQPEDIEDSSNTESASKQLESEDLASESEQSKSKVHEITSDSSDSDADTEAETTVNSDRSQKTHNESSFIDTTTKTDRTSSTKVNSSECGTNKLQKKNLTPKQQKLHEQRLKAREEKERRIQEDREQKQREKEEREMARKREREEKEEQRRKEREEKEEQRRKEREEKERKRLAEIEAKNEEKRKRNEAKEEEQRKKEEERKRKEQEKEEAELKKKKAAMAFTKFFSRPAQDATASRTADKDVAEEEHELLAFRPFQIKGDMTLAPIVRKKLNDQERANLVSAMQKKDQEIGIQALSKELYLAELFSGAIKPYKWIPPPEATEGKQKNDDDDDDDDDVILVEDELERAGQAIVEEHSEKIEHYRAKFFKFHENRRPPYFGTWRKKSSVITPRRPFAQEKKFFDYEIDSDDEWEEEEPGESLDGSDDDKEKESDDEDYEVDNEWFVPHGHLSEEEMQNEDDLGENNDREAQKAKLQILQQEFAQEMKKKTEKIKPRLIGCIWVDENGNQPELCPKIIWDTLNNRAILCAEPLIMEEPNSAADKNGETNTINGQNVEKNNNGEIKLKPITLNDDMLKQLVKLVHGNTHSRNFLIKEFIAYIEANEESVRNGDMRAPLKSTVREKIDECAKWQAVELTASNNNNSNKDGSKSSKAQKTKKKLCWVVAKDMLESMNLQEMDLKNNWEYILQSRRSKVFQKEDATPTVEVNAEDSNGNSEISVDQCSVASGNVTEPQTPVSSKSNNNNNNPDIKKFTKVLTAEEITKELKKKTEQMKTPSSKQSANLSPANKKSKSISNSQNLKNPNQTPAVKKRVPLLISVDRGQTISTPDKNARISQFLKTINNAKQKEKPNDDDSTTPMQIDDVVVLD